MEDLPVAVQNLLDEPHPAVVSTASRHGAPQASVVWIERTGNDLAFFCNADSMKVRNLSGNPTAVVIVVDPQRVFEPGAPCYVRLTGRATIERLIDTDFPDRLAKRYMGVDEFPHRGDYLKVTVAVNSWSGMGPFPGTPSGWGD